MTDELDSYGRGSYIEEFVSDSKFYAYIVQTDGRIHETCKVKDITLNYENSRRVNIIKKLLARKNTGKEEDDEEEYETNLRFSAIRRTAFHEIVTQNETKICAPVLLKRRFINNQYSVPYGYLPTE